MPIFASKPASISLLAGVPASKSLLRPTNIKGIIEKFFPGDGGASSHINFPLKFRSISRKFFGIGAQLLRSFYV
jgi:hypothetical protein